MKKNNYRPFDNEIRQMRKNHVILVNLMKVKPFKKACAERGIELAQGSEYSNGVIFYENE